MTKNKLIRLPDDLSEKFENDIKQRGFASENEGFIKAVEHFLECKAVESTAAMRMIVLLYPAKCLKCRREIDRGEWALYGRGIGAICIDCYVQRIGDKAVIAKFLKIREYERIIHALKLEAERLASNVEFGQVAEKIENLHRTNSEIHKAINEYFQKALGTEQERQKLDEILRQCERLFPLIEELEKFLLSHKIKPLEKKKAPQYET